MEGLESAKPEIKPAEEGGNFQEERERAEMRVATRFKEIGVEALGRIKAKPEFSNISGRSC